MDDGVSVVVFVQGRPKRWRLSGADSDSSGSIPMIYSDVLSPTRLFQPTLCRRVNLNPLNGARPIKTAISTELSFYSSTSSQDIDDSSLSAGWN
nr:hypothetical protein CFP56_74631 [Quercus suber]